MQQCSTPPVLEMKDTKALEEQRLFIKKKEFRLENKLKPFTNKNVGIKYMHSLIENIFLAVCQTESESQVLEPDTDEKFAKEELQRN